MSEVCPRSDRLYPQTVFPEDESPGLHGFLNVIVHSASGLKQSLSELCFTHILLSFRETSSEEMKL